MAAVSIWWPTPARPESHFNADELASSYRYHRPIRRVAVAAMAARIGLLLAMAVACAIWAERGRWAAFDRELGWLEAVTAPRVLVGAGLTVLAIRLPSVVSDGWFEFRFRRGIEGYKPVPIGWFALTTATLAFGTWLVLAVMAGAAYRLAVTVERWALLVAVAVIGATVLSMLSERWVRGHMPGGERALELDEPLQTRLDALADRFDIDNPVFTRAGPLDPPNACALGVGPFRRVSLTESLLAEESTAVEFVVAHELTHLARRHLLAQTVLRALIQLVAVAVVATLIGAALPWRLFDLEPLDPIGLPLLALVLLLIGALVRPVESWVSRGQERSADAGAIAATGPLAANAARSLYTSTAVELDPPPWVRLFAGHPAPAERLEFLARHRRSQQVAERSGSTSAL